MTWTKPGPSGIRLVPGNAPHLARNGVLRLIVPIFHSTVRRLGFRLGRLRLGAREPAPRRRRRWWLLGWFLLGFRDDGEGGGLFFFLGGLFRGGLFPLPKEMK